MNSYYINIINNYIHRPLMAILCLSVMGPALAIDEINSTFLGKLAVEGYDTVAYFTEIGRFGVKNNTRINGKTPIGASVAQ